MNVNAFTRFICTPACTNGSPRVRACLCAATRARSERFEERLPPRYNRTRDALAQPLRYPASSQGKGDFAAPLHPASTALPSLPSTFREICTCILYRSSSRSRRSYITLLRSRPYGELLLDNVFARNIFPSLICNYS